LVRSFGRAARAALAAALFCAAPHARTEEEPPPTEWEVKAAYLYNFTRYVEWPESALKPGTPFVVAVFGRDPFGGALDAALAGKTVGTRPIEIRRLDRAEKAAFAHVLFVSSSERDAASALRAVQGLPVLTVADADGLPPSPIVRFRVVDRRVRFDVNLAQAEVARLKISSHFLRLALSVEGR